MATAGKETPMDILTCTICLETLRKPKKLPCLHTFCESCLVSYITSGLEKHHENVNCPLCREAVNRPNKTCTPEEWVDDLPFNFLLVGLIESQKVVRPEKLCMLCERAGQKPVEKATFFCIQCTDTLCKTCERYHSLVKSSFDHEVKPITDLDYSYENHVFPVLKNICDQHKKEELKLYCVDHKTPCCCICVSIFHRKCGEVKSLEDAAKGIKESKKINDIRGEYENLEKHFEDDITESKAASEKLEKDYENALETIESKHEILRKAVNRQESERKSELEKVYNEIKDRKEGVLIGLENKQRIIVNERKVLEAWLQGASETQIFLEMTKFEKLIKIHEEENKSFKTLTHEIGPGLDLEDVNTDEIVSAIEKLKILREKTKTSIIRYRSLGKQTAWWAVKSKSDAIMIEVSADIILNGFLSYGCKKAGSECNVKIFVKHGEYLLAELETKLSKNLEDYKNNLTELKIGRPVKLLAKTKYEVIFVMKSDNLCNYGSDGKPDIECEGVIFKFSKSFQSDNGTDVTKGQIPGFIFTRVF